MLGTGESAVMGTWHLAPFMVSPPALIVISTQRSPICRSMIFLEFGYVLSGCG